MFELKWFYEIILIIYGLSIIGYFFDFIQRNQKVNMIAFWLLGMVWIMQTVFLLNEVLVNHNFPIATLSDSLFFYAWILITFSLIISRFFPTHFIVFFTNVFGFFILLLYITSNANKQTFNSGIQFIHEILVTHITLAMVSYGFFTISFLFSLMFMIQYRFLKRKKGLRWMWRFGDLKQLDTYSLRAIVTGVPLLLIAVILGIVWAYVSKSEFYWFDMKTAGSIFVLAVYIVYLLLRIVKGYQGKTISMFNVAAFLILIINFLLSSSLSNFHF
jgi:HemX protein